MNEAQHWREIAGTKGRYIINRDYQIFDNQEKKYCKEFMALDGDTMKEHISLEIDNILFIKNIDKIYTETFGKGI